jgi:tRNA/tmRNA/rRNA uracil-C5-methylase (TrmA/RlmC/RlmD family)
LGKFYERIHHCRNYRHSGRERDLLARDVRDLNNNFTIESVTPLDMFPQTAEIEVAAHLQA